MSEHTLPEADQPWMMRVYSGHTSAEASNQLFHSLIERGQTGLSVAFDLPTQTAYGSDHPLSQGEVGRAGVPVDSLDDMRRLFDGIPLGEVNTSMTINAPAAWLLAMYVAVAEEQGVDRGELRGTTQNDMAKEFLSRHLWAFEADASFRLQADVIEFAAQEMPRWNPVNFCSYHLQEAGATPVQETAFMFDNALSVLDEFRDGSTRAERSGVTVADVVGRSSFFLDFGMRFVEEVGKAKAMTRLWDEYTADRYGIKDPKLRRFRYGTQVNSVNLTAEQPENNVPRIMLEALGATLSKEARARAIQLPAWSEALGIPRSIDQQWSLRAQQVLAFETDLLEYPDIFEGSVVMEALVERIMSAAKDEQAKVETIRQNEGRGAALAYMVHEMTESAYAYQKRIEAGEQPVVGVNRYVDTEESPLRTGDVVRIDLDSERKQRRRNALFMDRRDGSLVQEALQSLSEAAVSGANLVPPSIEAARAGVTTKEWGDTLAEVFGRHHEQIYF